MPNAPRYRVINRCFIAPHVVEPGSIITYTGEPGDHLHPLNAEAAEALEAWYDKDHTYEDRDSHGQLIREITIKPNANKRPITRPEVEAETFTLVSEPPKQKPGTVLGLAEALATRAKDFERPGPAIPTGEPDVPIETSVEGAKIETLAPAKKEAK